MGMLDILSIQDIHKNVDMQVLVRGKNSTELKKNIYLEIEALLKKKKKVNIHQVSAYFALRTGFSKETILGIFKLMEESGIIDIHNDEAIWT